MADKSLLVCNEVEVSSEIKIRIPTVEEVLNDEQFYYGIVNQITASPYSMMVQLDDAGIDFTTTTEFELFIINSAYIFSKDLSMFFGNTFSKLYEVLSDDNVSLEIKQQALFPVRKQENDVLCLYDMVDDVLIDEYIFTKIADTFRKINIIEKDNRKAGNEAAKKYLITKNRRYLKRHQNDEYKPFFENYVVSLVNKQEFKYNYEETLKLSIYKFNRSLKQIKHVVEFDKITNGIYAGTVDASKITDKSALSFIGTK